MKIIVTGATGTVGSELVRQAVIDPDVEKITCLVRKPPGINDPKVTDVIHTDFLRYDGLENIFKENDVCLWCLGISQSRVSKEDYYRITYEYTVAAATAMLKSNPSITFMFLSGQGADSSEKSRIRFARVKGQTENSLMKLNFKKLVILRPGGILPVTKSSDPGVYKKLEISFIHLMRFVAPLTVVTTDVLAKAMLKSVKNDMGKVIISHREILHL